MAISEPKEGGRLGCNRPKKGGFIGQNRVVNRSKKKRRSIIQKRGLIGQKRE